MSRKTRPQMFLAAFLATLCLAPLAVPAAPSTSTQATSTQATSKPAVVKTTTIATRFANYGHAGTWLLQRDGGAPQVLHGADRATMPLRPASTFKVFLALVALETGTLRGADEVVPWDGKRYPNQPAWEKDMALREAMQSSSENYFGTLADRIGHDRLATWVARAGYGNGRIGEVPAKAWLDGVLTVTARQQLEFVERLRRNDLPFSAKTIAAVKAAMLDETIGSRRVYGKTGTLDGNAWWIGWVEGGWVEGRKAPAASFVLGIDLKTPDNRMKRVALGKQLLREDGLLPPR
jgi:beta-lactamase class D